MFVLIAQDVRDVTVKLQKILVPKDRKTSLKVIFICFVLFVVLSQTDLYRMLAVEDRGAPVEPRPINLKDVVKDGRS